MNTLHRKLLRELWQLKGQMASIALVVATGIMTVLTMRGSYDTLVQAQQSYYAQTRFADAWAPLKRAPNSLRERIQAIPGVANVDTRVSFLATLDLPGLDAPAQARLVSLPEQRRPEINDIRIRSGRYLAPGAASEVLISSKFADARALKPGDTLRAIINGRARTLDIVGIAISPEHTYAVPPGALYPDDKRYGVLWMGRKVLGPAYDMDGAFNEAVLTLSPDANPQAVLSRIDTLLDPYGGLGAYLRKDQASHLILQGELDSNKVMGTVVPAVFLGVAAFLLNLVLTRLIATQRGEIAVLKAFGYRSREVAIHYLLFAMAAVAFGAAIGAVAGTLLGSAYVNLYGAYFDFPQLDYQLSPLLLAIATAITVVAAAAGALLAVRRAALLPPAEAMRPEPPASFKPGWLERSGLTRPLPSSARMVLRNVQRKPLQALLSSLGVSFSVAILIIGLAMFDGVQWMMDLQFRVIQREDLSVSFDEPRTVAVTYDFYNLPGVTRVEAYRLAPARLRSGHFEKEIAIQGLAPDGRLRRIVSASGGEQPLPAEGLVLSAILARQLHLAVGDQVDVAFLEGQRRRMQLPVAGIVDDLLGVSATMNRDALQRAIGGPVMVSGAYLSVAADALPQLERTLKAAPAVAGVASPSTMLASFEKQMDDSLFIAVGFLLGFACVIAVAVIYNGARISLSERGRELASLRVMGFRRSEAAMLLLGEQALITLMAIPIGWLLGYGLSYAVVAALQTDTYRIPLVVHAPTYLLAAAIVVAAAVASGALVRRRINRLDLIAVLKTRE
ncbi:FtsX-like permease family protein [Simplicispira suum]|uniref:ABC transporter permease n=1 Tax=Simplicispira suum TaxID=2109915 RepID=A0A2S0N3N2_9BURK|nr:FtsX-like permease family protein [Simplicispira suum]AVO42749.1 ABC transporter permease [Simplicispira suum]